MSTLTHKAANGADAAQIANVVVSIWKDIDTSLRPIIGQRGVASLYRRSLHVSTSHHPWLGHLQDPMHAVLDLAALQATLSRQTSSNAAAGGGDLLQAFHELLSSLVGTSLTDQLLGSIWAKSSSGDAAQDGTR